MYVKALDGVRALAIIAVMLVHAGAPGASIGWIGVDLFFVLSGFLITTLLMNEHASKGTISLYKFYIRRVLRLVPAYYLYLFFFCIAIFFSDAQLHSVGSWDPVGFIASLWGYFNNLVPRGGFWEHDHLVIQMWSLSVEEQYYLVWPFLLILALRSKRTLILIPGLILLVLMIVRLTFDFDLDFKQGLFTRGISLFISSFVAILCQQSVTFKQFLQQYQVQVCGILICLVFYLMLATELNLVTDSAIRQTPIVLFDIVAAFTIASIWYSDKTRLASALSIRPLVYTGKISYGLYLYHMFAHYLVWHVFYFNIEGWSRYINYGLRLVLYFTFAFSIATLSYHYYEKRFLKLKNKLR